MSSEHLIYQFQLDPAETVRASSVLRQRQRFAWINWAVWLMLLALAASYLASGRQLRELWLLGLVALFLLAFQWLAPRMQRRQLRRAYGETPNLRGPQTYEFSDVGLAITGATGTTNLGWDSFVEALETPEFFLLFYSKQCALYLPKRVVEPHERAVALRSLLRAMLGPRAAAISLDQPSSAPA